MSCASAERRGAHLLQQSVSNRTNVLYQLLLPLAIRDISPHLVQRQLAHLLAIVLPWTIHVNVQDVFGNHLKRASVHPTRMRSKTNLVALLVVLVLHDEDHVKTRQNRRLEVNVLGEISDRFIEHALI